LFVDLVNEKARFLGITPQELQQWLRRGEGGPAGGSLLALMLASPVLSQAHKVWQEDRAAGSRPSTSGSL
jgi:hypothetical protein